MEKQEIVIQNGRVRQAGTVDPDGKAEDYLRHHYQRNLFAFAQGVMGLDRMTRHLHMPVCNWLQLTPTVYERRKLLLMPRDHLKTSTVRALAAHILIQSKEDNLYFPGKAGADTRILLANETSTNAEHQLRWIMAQWESNAMLRALWPEETWGDARRQSPKWNEKEMLIPRPSHYPESSIETIGVGGAVVGRHYDVFIKDDLVTLEAANSPTLMEKAIEWHRTSRALMDQPDWSFEVIIGTRWAAYDLYQYILDNDPSVEVVQRAAIENGRPIFPEMFSMQILEQLRIELGPLFYLLYMNAAADPALVDFDTENVRKYEIDFRRGVLLVDEDERDVVLSEAMHAPSPASSGDTRGVPLNADNYSRLFGPYEMRRKQLEL